MAFRWANIIGWKLIRHLSDMISVGSPSNWCSSKCHFYLDGSWHEDFIKWKHFPRYWPFVRGIHRSPVNSPHKSQWQGALMFFFISVWINGWVNNREVSDLRRHHAHYNVNVMECWHQCCSGAHFTNNFPSQFKCDGNFILLSSKY